MSRWKCCNIPSANTAQGKGDRRKRTSDQALTRDLHSFMEFSHMSYRSQSQILHLPSPYVPIVGVPLYSDRLKTYASRLVQCVMVMGSAGNSV